tara:strand:- start:127 stop:1842 length:1716 start_codon:yes stop_codon:yes gene_type:complete
MKTPYAMYTLKEAHDLLDFGGTPVFADTETLGFYGKVRLLQLFQEGLDHVIMVEWPNVYEAMTMLGKFDTKWHNAHYDITTLQQQSGTRWVPERFDDTFLLARLAFPDKEKFSLDEALHYSLGYDPYVKQGLDKKVLQKTNWGAPKLTEEQLNYAATDVYYMPALWNSVHDKLEAPSYKLDMLTLRYCLDFQWNGMPVDDDRLVALHKANDEKIKSYAMPINVNSWQQVRPYIGEDESDGLALATQTLEGNERSKNVQTVRKLIKQQSFIKKFDTQSGRIFGKFLPSARSGRLTSKDQNLQQLPRALKSAFGVENGRVLIYADYAQLELRTICAITTCIAMMELFRKGEDLHGFTAEMIFGKDWTKAHRQLSKTYNFSFLYGGGINMLISILILTAGVLLNPRQANKDRARWRNLWKEIYAWQEKGISTWQKGYLGSTPLGRRYKAKMMTDQLNIENQGAGAEVAKLALHYYYPKLMAYNKEHDVDFMLCNFIHDSFITEGPNDPVHYKAIAKMKAEAMQKAWFEMSKLFAVKDLPMPVNVLVGTNWGDIEDDDMPNMYEYDLEGMAMYES